MYRMLCLWLPEAVAGVVIACWYAVLVLLLWLFWNADAGTFRYLSL